MKCAICAAPEKSLVYGLCNMCSDRTAPEPSLVKVIPSAPRHHYDPMHGVEVVFKRPNRHKPKVMH